MLRFLSRRRLILALGVVVIALLAASAGVVSYLNSPAFNIRARRYIANEIERRTGAKVTVDGLYWSLWQKRIQLDDLILRGSEPAGHTPLAHFTRIDIGLNFRSLLQRRIDLYELTFTQPEFHILVTPDGKTNFPTPRESLQKPSGFELSIQNFNVMNGTA